MNFDFKIIIPVKGNSERVKNKNSLPFGDKPTMLEWKISQLLEVFKPEDIVISTDCEAFKQIAKQYGTLLHERKDIRFSEQNHPQYSFADLQVDIFSNFDVEHFIWAQTTSPLVSPNLYKEACLAYKAKVIESKEYDSLTFVNTTQEFFWNDVKAINYEANSKMPASQTLPIWYRMTHGIYMIPKELALKNRYYCGVNPYKMEVSKLAGFDIDTPEDYEICKALYPLYLEKNKK